MIIVLTLDEIDGVRAIMPQVKKEWADEIVFVDGGSKDGTVEEATKMGFRVIHQKDKGEGNAMRLGVEETESDYVLFFGPDGNCLPEEMPKLIQKIKDGGYDAVHTSRFGKNAKKSEDANFIELFGNCTAMILIDTYFF